MADENMEGYNKVASDNSYTEKYFYNSLEVNRPKRFHTHPALRREG
jgi:hypothetical protein